MGRAFENAESTIFARIDRVASSSPRSVRTWRSPSRVVGPARTATRAAPRTQNAGGQRAQDRSRPRSRRRAATARPHDVILYELRPERRCDAGRGRDDNVTRTSPTSPPLQGPRRRHGDHWRRRVMFHGPAAFRPRPRRASIARTRAHADRRRLIALDSAQSDKGEPELVARCAFSDFGALQPRSRAAVLTPISSGRGRRRQYVELPEGQLSTRCSSSSRGSRATTTCERLCQPGLSAARPARAAPSAPRPHAPAAPARAAPRPARRIRAAPTRAAPARRPALRDRPHRFGRVSRRCHRRERLTCRLEEINALSSPAEPSGSGLASSRRSSRARPT